MLNALDTVLSEDGFIERRRAERVSVVHLEGTFGVAVGGRELGDDRRTTGVQSGPKKAAVNPVILEIFVNPNKILVAIPESAGVENSRVNHGRGAG